MAWCYYCGARVIFLVRETLTLLRQRTEIPQQMAVTLSKLLASPKSHLARVITLKSYENIQPQNKRLSISSSAQPGISAHFHIWGWPEHLQLEAPERNVAEWIAQVNYGSGNICDIFILEILVRLFYNLRWPQRFHPAVPRFLLCLLHCTAPSELLLLRAHRTKWWMPQGLTLQNCTVPKLAKIQQNWFLSSTGARTSHPAALLLISIVPFQRERLWFSVTDSKRATVTQRGGLGSLLRATMSNSSWGLWGQRCRGQVAHRQGAAGKQPPGLCKTSPLGTSDSGSLAEAAPPCLHKPWEHEDSC